MADDTPPIHDAAIRGDVEATEGILRDDPSQVNAIFSPSIPDLPLHAAAGQGRWRVAEVLLRHGADVNAPGEWDMTPLHHAALTNSVETIDLLVRHGADLEASPRGVGTPLLWAAGKGIEFREGVDALIRHGANLHARMEDGTTLMQMAGLGQSVGVAEALVERGVEPDVAAAMLLGRADFVRRLLATDPDLIRKTDDPGRLLVDMVGLVRKALVERRADHPLDPATLDLAREIIHGHVDLFEGLYAQGVPNSWGHVALNTALQLPDPAIAEVLLNHRAHLAPGGGPAGIRIEIARSNPYCSNSMVALLGQHDA